MTTKTATWNDFANHSALYIGGEYIATIYQRPQLPLDPEKAPTMAYYLQMRVENTTYSNHNLNATDMDHAKTLTTNLLTQKCKDYCEDYKRTVAMLEAKIEVFDNTKPLITGQAAAGNSIDLHITATEIVNRLETATFDDCTDSSGYFVVRDFGDDCERCVDVYKSSECNQKPPHYTVYASFEDGDSSYYYTKDLSIEGLEVILREIAAVDMDPDKPCKVTLHYGYERMVDDEVYHAFLTSDPKKGYDSDAIDKELRELLDPISEESDFNWDTMDIALPKTLVDRIRKCAGTFTKESLITFAEGRIKDNEGNLDIPGADRYAEGYHDAFVELLNHIGAKHSYEFHD